jgi:hypothetical protein
LREQGVGQRPRAVTACRLRFAREGRVLELVVSADGPRRSRLQWQPAQA